jgi:hypothetical protein
MAGALTRSQPAALSIKLMKIVDFRRLFGLVDRRPQRYCGDRFGFTIHPVSFYSHSLHLFSSHFFAFALLHSRSFAPSHLPFRHFLRVYFITCPTTTFTDRSFLAHGATRPTTPHFLLFASPVILPSPFRLNTTTTLTSTSNLMGASRTA